MKEPMLHMQRNMLYCCMCFIKRTVLAVMFLLSMTCVVYAQCPNPLDPNCDYEGDPDDAVPLDDNIIWLVIAGLVLGVIFYKKHRVQQT